MGETARPPERPSLRAAPSDSPAAAPRRPSSTAPLPPSDAAVDLYAPITSDVILEVRSGKMKPLEGLKILSGIDKGLCAGRVKVTPVGIVDDEHDYTFHGGIDKAVHGYCSAHYATWKSEFPTAADRFRPGGFGENLVFARLNERNIHIGDVFAVGPPGHPGGDEDGGGLLLLQVSLPRQPCFKLNHRFGLRNFAPNTWKTSRTGWYYRVLRAGTVQAGDEVRLVRRPHPAWPLERVQEYLHRTPDEMAMVAELAAIEEFGAECKNAFRNRLAKHEAQARKKARLAAGENKEERWRPFRVVEKRRQTPRITSFVFEAVPREAGAAGDGDGDGDEENELFPGSHVRLRLGDGGDDAASDAAAAVAPLVRSYSIVGGSRTRFELGVAFDPATSRGGARFLHERVAVGSVVPAGAFAMGVPIVSAASHHVFVAGGVGITAFLAQLEGLTEIHYSCVLHYAVRSADEVAFAERLRALGPDVVVVYDASRGQRMDVGKIVAALPWNAHISFCGPPRLMDAALQATRAAGLGDGDVHFEAFAADTAGEPFEAVVRRQSDESETSLQVDGDETLLDVLQREFGLDAVASSCEVGNCATCKITVRAGRIEHRGTALTSEEKAAGDSMLACVSRGIGRIEIEI